MKVQDDIVDNKKFIAPLYFLALLKIERQAVKFILKNCIQKISGDNSTFAVR